jgi:PLP dependent protein
MPLSDRLQQIKAQLPPSVTLIAVSKTKPVSDIMEAYQAGQRHFGENRVQELLEKVNKLPTDIKWHLIGHLQTNKVKYIASFIQLIHSVDSLKLLETIDKEAASNNRIIDCLLQVYIAREETKFGLSDSELMQLIDSDKFKELKNIRIAGLMGMATFTDDMEQVRKEFAYLKNLFELVKQKYFIENPWFKEISMGMSGDYLIAIREGSTMVRIGSLIFGER